MSGIDFDQVTLAHNETLTIKAGSEYLCRRRPDVADVEIVIAKFLGPSLPRPLVDDDYPDCISVMQVIWLALQLGFQEMVAEHHFQHALLRTQYPVIQSHHV